MADAAKMPAAEAPRDTRGSVGAARVLKLGGELLEGQDSLQRAAAGIAALCASSPLVVVHGGGREIDAELARRGIEKRAVDGLRITDAATLDAVVAVLAGTVNTRFVAALAAAGVPAVGLTGADGRIGASTAAAPFQAQDGRVVDLGLVGDPIPSAPVRLLTDLVALGYVPVIASVGLSAEGQLLNVNADTLAAHVAGALGAAQLLIAGTTPGVLDADGSTLPLLDTKAMDALIADGSARAGMVAKLTACRAALAAGVPEVLIFDGRRSLDAQHGVTRLQ